MAKPTRLGHETVDDDEVRLSVDDLNEDSGLSMNGSQTRGRDFNTNKKRRQSRLFDSSPFDNGRTWFSQEARRFSTRATNLIVQVPALQLRRIAQTSGVHSIRSETQHFVGIATLHGPLRIYRSKGKYRLFWIIAMIFCVTMFFYQTYKLIELYLEKPIVSQVSFLQPEEGMEFPLVTLCSFNYVNKRNLAEFKKSQNVSEDFINFVLQSLVGIDVLSTFIDPKNLSVGYIEYLEYMKRNPNFEINDFFRSSSLSCNETLRICNVGSEEFDCCEYAKVVLTDMGNCFQIDLHDHPSSTTKQIGVNNGLKIYANFNSDNQQDETMLIPDFLINSEIGFRYFVHARNDYPFITSEGIGVQLGHRTFSAISPHRFVLMNRSEGGKCIDEWPDEISSKNLSIFTDGIGDYSSTKCKAICLGTFFYESCGCTPFLYNYNGTFPTCTVYQNYYECLNKALNVSVDSSADLIMKNVNPPCFNSCKMECKRWDYQIFNSYSQPFSRSVTAYMMKHEKVRKAKLNRDFVGVDIYYRDIAYTEYKQVHKTTMSEIWSSLGGNMGLFLGMSILSVIEVIIYLCKISWLFVSRKRRQHMIAKEEKKKARKMGISGIIEAANAMPMHLPMPSHRSSTSSGSSSSETNSDSMATILPAKTMEPPTMANRLKKFADSVKKKSTSVWPKKSSSGFEEMNEIESPPPKSEHENFSSYYLNNLITERTLGMGRAMNKQDEDFVELELEVESKTSSGSRQAIIKRTRTLSMSIDDRNALAVELEKRRPTYISLEVTRTDLKALQQQKPNFFRRSYNRFAGNALNWGSKRRKTSTPQPVKSLTTSPTWKTQTSAFEFQSGATNYDMNSTLPRPLKPTRLMEFQMKKASENLAMRGRSSEGDVVRIPKLSLDLDSNTYSQFDKTIEDQKLEMAVKQNEENDLMDQKIDNEMDKLAEKSINEAMDQIMKEACVELISKPSNAQRQKSPIFPLNLPSIPKRQVHSQQKLPPLPIDLTQNLTMRSKSVSPLVFDDFSAPRSLSTNPTLKEHSSNLDSKKLSITSIEEVPNKQQSLLNFDSLSTNSIEEIPNNQQAPLNLNLDSLPTNSVEENHNDQLSSLNLSQSTMSSINSIEEIPNNQQSPLNLNLDSSPTNSTEENPNDYQNLLIEKSKLNSTHFDSKTLPTNQPTLQPSNVKISQPIASQSRILPSNKWNPVTIIQIYDEDDDNKQFPNINPSINPE